MKNNTFISIMLLSIIILFSGCRTWCPPHDYYIKAKVMSSDTTLMNLTEQNTPQNMEILCGHGDWRLSIRRGRWGTMM